MPAKQAKSQSQKKTYVAIKRQRKIIKCSQKQLRNLVRTKIQEENHKNGKSSSIECKERIN